MLPISESALFRQDLEGGINLFLGAGFSVLARNAAGGKLPLGDELKRVIVETIGLQQYEELDLAALYAVAASEERERVNSLLRDLYIVNYFDPRYDLLRKLDIRAIYTTNIDDLPYHIFSPRPSENTKILHDVYVYSTPRRPDDVISFIPLHGNVRHEDNDFVFTPGQISSAFASDRETWYVFQRELQQRPTVFLGYAMRDAGVLQAAQGSLRSETNKWIVLHEPNSASARYFESLGFKVVSANTAEVLDYLGSINFGAKTPSQMAAPKYGAIPSFAEVAQRPVRNFFLGAEPEWSDAYSDQVVRRRVNDRIKEQALRGNNVALVGLPLSGKSTIIKQVAVDLSATRRAIYFDRLNDPLADQIIAEHTNSRSKDKTIVLIDNMIDSRQSIKKLAASNLFQFISSETSIYFDSVNLKRFGADFVVFSCSEIERADLQRILDSIPQGVKRHHISSYSDIAAAGEELGLFESMQRHVYDEALIPRFREKLREFEQRDRVAFDVYIMACYVAMCRCFVSFDMIYMFLDVAKKDYGTVYAITARIGDFLAELELEDDPHQDYFSVRSGALAKIALRVVPDAAFGRVYERFHASVPPKVIPDYDVFRRYAYDNDFARRAFPAVADGRSFYRRLVALNDNPYHYQHGAVYLSKMREYKEAFEWIDTALSKSRFKIFSIRNSHARILFEANIDVLKRHPGNQTALAGIVESMGVLDECIERDPRRNYHLMRFSDQAIQYHDVQPGHKSEEWLRSARNYLVGTMKEAMSPGSSDAYNLPKYRRLVGEVERRISTS
jgi:hypothetical protein